MMQSDWKRVYAPVPQDFHEALLAAAQSVREEQPVMKKRIGILVTALVLALITGTALAIAKYYSVRDFQAGGNPSAEFEAHVIELDKTYETDEIILTVGDAVFDGTRIALTMDLTAKDPDQHVYIYPMLTGWCGDRRVDLDIEGMRGDFTSGFLFPSLTDNSLEGKYGFDATIYEDTADGPVSWKLTMQVLIPNWPVRGMEGTPPSHHAYMQLFSSAYLQREILTSNGDSLVEYASRLPVPQGMTEEQWAKERLGTQLVQCGAFTLADTFECTFTAPLPDSVKLGVGAGQTFPFEEYIVEFVGMDLSFTRVRYELNRVYPKGTDAEAMPYPGYAYVLIDQDGNILESTAWSIGKPNMREDGAVTVRYKSDASIQGNMPTSIRFVPLMLDSDGQVSQPPRHDEAHAFVVQIQ